jgi:hypothetical protein
MNFPKQYAHHSKIFHIKTLDFKILKIFCSKKIENIKVQFNYIWKILNSASVALVKEANIVI